MKLVAALVIAVLLAVVAALAYRGSAIEARASAEAIQVDLEDARQALRALRAERAEKLAKARALDAIGIEHEEDRRDAEAVPDAVVADLRSGIVRLRREWAGCETARLSEATAGAVERDALAASRERLAGAVVRVGRDADDQLRACQAVVRADRE